MARLLTLLALAVLSTAAAARPALAVPAGGTGGYPHASMPCAHAPYARTGRGYWCRGGDWGPVRDTAKGYSVRTTYSAEFGYGYRNCTDWAAFRLAQLGVPVDKLKGLGNGGHWAAAAKGKIPVDTTPAVGAAAVEFGDPGHVAVVEAVHGNVIRVSEYNKHLDGTYDTRTGTPAQLNFQRFVHFESYESVRARDAMGKIVTVSQNRTSYYFDGKLHWIPDKNTYYCVLDRGKRVLRVPRQAQVAALGDGKPGVRPCLSPRRVLDHVVRESGGASFYVTGGGPLAAGGTQWHPIPDRATYACLAANHGVVDASRAEVDSLRGANGQHEGPQAICGSRVQAPAPIDPQTTAPSATDGGAAAPPAGQGVYGRGIAANGHPVVSSSTGGRATTASAGDTLTCTGPSFTASGRYAVYYWWYRSVFDGTMGWQGTYVSDTAPGPVYAPHGSDVPADAVHAVALWCVVEAELADGSGWTYTYSSPIAVRP